MTAVILAGGLGTRLSEETVLKPKPMVDVGGKPLLWHIMKIYSHYGINDFVICCGYKGYLIKEYFANYAIHMSDITVDMSKNNIKFHHKEVEPWKVTLIDTGENTMTGGRIKRIEKYISDETFCLTYGDGLADININKLIEHHNSKNVLATMTTVRPPGRFGAVKIDANNIITSFEEKPSGDGMQINGGFFVLHKNVLDYIDNDMSIWEKKPLEQLSLNGELSAFSHEGFWQPMDTLRDKIKLEELWRKEPPWKIW